MIAESRKGKPAAPSPVPRVSTVMKIKFLPKRSPPFPAALSVPSYFSLSALCRPTPTSFPPRRAGFDLLARM